MSYASMAEITSNFLLLLLTRLSLRTGTIHVGLTQLQRHEILKRFNDPDDDSIEYLFVSYLISSQGLNAQGSCCRMILLEPGLSRNEEFQAIGRIHRHLQKEACIVYRLYLTNSMDKYWKSKSTEKFIPEPRFSWSSNWY